MSIRDLFQDGQKKPNLLFIITDQERSLQHWPADFTEKHLPAMCKLQQSGITFTNAFTNACMCSPSRSVLMTSQFPTLTGVTTTGSPQPRYSLPETCINLTDVLREAGYEILEWQGKWHLGNSPQDYGFTGWDPPDAGNYLILNETLGGGFPANDDRFLHNILHFLDAHDDPERPFCLVASFVNPHDVYVSQYNVEEAGYRKEHLNKVQVPLPTNCKENLSHKPRAHKHHSWNRIPHQHSMQDYVNFYAFLHTVVDAQIMAVLQKLDTLHLTESTLVLRLADHGEQALSHGLVEKFYNAYEESIHIPLVISNPKLDVTKCNALVSSMDLLPTLADLLQVGDKFQGCFYGKSLVPLLMEPQNDDGYSSVHFTYDDIPSRSAPSIIRCIRTPRYKYAVYFLDDGSDADWELYDLEKDPKEDFNVAGTRDYMDIQQELDRDLQQTMRNMETYPAFLWPPHQTKHSRGGPPPNVRRIANNNDDEKKQASSSSDVAANGY